MKKNGAAYLRIAGFLEIIIGIGSILLTVWILKEGKDDQVVHGLNVAKDALLTLVAIYAIAGFRLVSGLVGIVLANKPKKYMTCLILGTLLLFLSITSMNKIDHSLDNMIYNYISLLIPSIYIFGALKSKKYLEQADKK